MKNKEQFFEELYREEYDQICGYIRRTVWDRDAVEDIAQETFCEAYRKIKVLELHPNVGGWLRCTAKFKIMKWWEKQEKYCLDKEYVIENFQEESNSYGDDYSMLEFYSSARKELSEEELEMLRSYYEYGYTSRELAKEMGITESCFKIRIARMKKRLKLRLAGWGVFFLTAGSLLHFSFLWR